MSRWEYYEEEIDIWEAEGGKSILALNSLFYQIYNPITGQMEEYNENSDTYKTHYRGYVGEEKSEHTHDWKSYLGFSESYDFCQVESCKAKREYTGDNK